MKIYLLISICLCALSVIFGAFGAHKFKDLLDSLGRSETYNTAVLYQMFHALGMMLTFILGKIMDIDTDLCLKIFLVGIILFSGSLYLYSLNGPKWLVHITPIGGLFLISGWVSLFIKIFSIKN